METSVKTDLIGNIVSQEKECHLAFFGREFDLINFAEILKKHGEEKIRFWQSFGLEPHFLPKASLMPKDSYPGWKMKPDKWFYERISEGKLFYRLNGGLKKIETVELEGFFVLIDVRLKPDYDDGRQIYENDNLCGPIVEKLKESGKIDKNFVRKFSRFNVSADEFEKHVKSALVKLLEVDLVVLEPAIVASVIPQLYPYMPRKNDCNTDTWCWYEEYFWSEGSRIFGGCSSNGSIRVRYTTPDFRWDRLSFRPLAVLF